MCFYMGIKNLEGHMLHLVYRGVGQTGLSFSVFYEYFIKYSNIMKYNLLHKILYLFREKIIF